MVCDKINTSTNLNPCMEGICCRLSTQSNWQAATSRCYLKENTIRIGLQEDNETHNCY